MVYCITLLIQLIHEEEYPKQRKNHIEQPIVFVRVNVFQIGPVTTN